MYFIPPLTLCASEENIILYLYLYYVGENARYAKENIGGEDWRKKGRDKALQKFLKHNYYLVIMEINCFGWSLWGGSSANPCASTQ